MSGKNVKFIKKALPFFSIVLGSAFGLHYFQQVRYDFSRSRKEADTVDQIHKSLASSGIKTRKDVTVEDVYQEVAELDTDNWENIRGPREFEDNKQYEEAKKRQQEEAKLRKKLIREKLAAEE